MKENTDKKPFSPIMTEAEAFQWKVRTDIKKEISTRFWMLSALMFVLFLAIVSVILFVQ